MIFDISSTMGVIRETERRIEERMKERTDHPIDRLLLPEESLLRSRRETERTSSCEHLCSVCLGCCFVRGGEEEAVRGGAGG